MRKTKRRIEQFPLWDHTGIQRHLEHMAAKGWMLEKMTVWYWQYRKIQPQRVHFAVTYFPAASEFDPGPSERQQMFQDFCHEAGWQPIAQIAQMQIFSNPAAQPVPVETDAAVQVENVHAAMKKNYLIGCVALLLVGLLNCGMFLRTLWDDPLRQLSDSSNLFTAFFYLLLIAMSLIEILSYFSWYCRAKAAAELDGSFVPSRSFPKLRRVGVLLVVVSLLLWLFFMEARQKMFFLVFLLGMVVVMVLVVGIKNLFKAKKMATGVTRTATFIGSIVLSVALTIGSTALILHTTRSGWLEEDKPVETYEYNGYIGEIYHDELPLSVENLMELDYDGYSYQRIMAESPLLARLTAVQRPRINAPDSVPELCYTVTKIKFSPLYELCLNSVLRKYSAKAQAAAPEEFRNTWVEQDATPWNAQVVYQRYTGNKARVDYLVGWPDRIVELYFDWTPTQEQIAIVAQKLKDI